MAETAPDLLIPHELSGACAGLHCYSHDVDEADDPVWRACMECWHVYRSPGELQREWAANAPPDITDRTRRPWKTSTSAPCAFTTGNPSPAAQPTTGRW